MAYDNIITKKFGDFVETYSAEYVNRWQNLNCF